MELFKTSDLYLSAYILYKGFKPVKKPAEEDKIIFYTFPQSPELEAEVKAFYEYHTQVDALGVLESFRRVRNTQWHLKKKAEVE